ncbi:MAG: MBL fold metallo-hydrolase [Clostridiales bacterium]
MLKFIGIGSAFNTTLGNTSAYIKKGDNLLLIDCGGTVFSNLMGNNILDELKKITIIITHTHSDHIGSLGDLIFYVHYILKIKPNVVYPEKKIMENLLGLMGVNKELYKIIDEKEVNLDFLFYEKCRIKFLRSSHVDDISSYSFIIKYKDIKYYYSSDSNKISDEILSMFKNSVIDYIYQDTCGIEYSENVHLSLMKLKEIIPETMRHRVYCMHYDEYIKKEDIELLGFNYICL